MKRRYLRRRTVPFSSLFHFALPTPSSAQIRGGDQGTLFACNVVQGYVRACVSSYIFVCCIWSTLFFGETLSPLAGV